MKWSKRGCRDRGVLEADDQVPNTECSLRCSQFEPFRLPLADIKSEMLISIERLRVLNGNEDEDEWCWGGELLVFFLNQFSSSSAGECVSPMNICLFKEQVSLYLLMAPLRIGNLLHRTI